MSKKSIIKKSLKYLTFSFLIGLLFTSCNLLINRKTPSYGTNKVSRIVPFNGSLWVGSSKLYKKDSTPSSSSKKYDGQWELVDAKCGQTELENIVSISTDGAYIYCCTEKKSGDVSYKRVYSSNDGENWSQIDISSITGRGDSTDSYAKDTYVLVFDNKAGNGSNNFTGRHAYARIWKPYDENNVYGVYEIHELQGRSVASDVVLDVSGDNESAAYYNGKTVFSRGLDIVSQNDWCYTTSSSDVQYTQDGEKWETVNYDAGSINELALTADYLLIGTEKGFFKAQLISGVPSSTLTEFSNNAGTLLTSRVSSLYVLDTSCNEGESDEYVVMPRSGTFLPPETFDEVGVYAYYPDRGTWAWDFN